MQNIDVILEPLRALLLQVGAFMPRLALAVLVLLGGGLIQQTFLILLSGLVVALAFGLGGRDRAAALIERWFPRNGVDQRP